MVIMIDFLIFFFLQMKSTVLRLAMITDGLPQEVMISQYDCGASRTLQKIKFYKDIQVCKYVCVLRGTYQLRNLLSSIILKKKLLFDLPSVAGIISVGTKINYHPNFIQ